MTESRADHPELDLLSAYLDGELEPPEHARMQAHVPGCLECSGVLAALRATLADLSALGQPALDDAAIAALDAAIARERAAAPSRLRGGKAWISGAVAASFIALIAALAIVRAPESRDTSPLRGADSGAGALALAAPVTVSRANYTADTARRALGRFLVGAESGAGPISGTDGSAPMVQSQQPAQYDARDAGARTRSTTAGSAIDEQLARCDGVIRSGTTLRPLEFEIALYDGREAYLLFYAGDAPSRIELYVVRRSDCFTLYFTQHQT